MKAKDFAVNGVLFSSLFRFLRSLYVETLISTPAADENGLEHGRERNLVLHFYRRNRILVHNFINNYTALFSNSPPSPLSCQERGRTEQADEEQKPPSLCKRRGLGDEFKSAAHDVYTYLRNSVLVCLLSGVLWIFFCFPFLVEAQEEAATVTSVVGDVTITIQEGSPTPGEVGAMLVEGDSLRTRDLSNAAVEFIDMSAVELEENTAVSVSIVAEDPATGATRAQLNLWWGNLRSLMPGEVMTGSSIAIETANALTEIGGATADSEFDGADAEVNYDPGVDTTIAVAHKFDVVMTNLLTEESIMVPEGSIGVVQGSTIQTIDMMITFPGGDDSLMDIIQSQGEGEYTVKAQLDRVAIVLKQLQLQAITIEGHTDNVGKEAANQELGQRRADNVKKYFVEYHDLPEELFQTVSYGEARPVASNATAEGRTKNRRVQISYGE